MGRPRLLPIIDAVKLKDAVLCADCEVITDTAQESCIVCGSRSLLNLSRILGGPIEAHRRAVVKMEEKAMANVRRELGSVEGRKRKAAG